MNDNIHHIRNKTNLHDFSNPIFGTTYYWAFLGSFPSLLLLFILLISNKEKFTDKDKTKLKKIIKQVDKGFNDMIQDFNTTENVDFFKEIYKLWNIYLINKYNIKPSDFSREKIKDILLKSKINIENVNAMDEILNICEMAQYSPLTSKDAQKTLNKSEDLIKKLEKNAA